MGIMSRRVLPACGNLCICCPELRARSRQPVKRYKKLLLGIFPKTQRVPMILRWIKCVRFGMRELQDEPPNDRKIGKLTQYASKNPLRIPKIAAGLEQCGYKALRSERYSWVRIVMRAYSELLSSCRDQMPLFAASALTMILVLLEQGQNDSMQVLACFTLVDFLNNQTDSSYMRDMDALLPKLCALGRETGEEWRRLPIRAAGLQALASLINFMGKYSHMPPEFDDIVALVLENYGAPLPGQEAETQDRAEIRHNWFKEVLTGEGCGPVAVMRGTITKLQLHKENSCLQDPSNLTRMETQSPKVWSQICVQNFARLSKEATTVRRVLEPMFQYFDAGKHWPPEKLALVVLSDMQHFMEKSGNEQLSLPMLIRHLDHKDVVNNLELKKSILEVIVLLARQSKVKSSVTVVGAMSDLLGHLQRSIESCMQASKIAKATLNLQKGLQHVLEECLIELAKRVGDAGLLFDMMATSLEKLSANPIISRTTSEAVCVLAHCVAYVPDQSYAKQVVPEVLFQELLQAMIHPDGETRVKVHCIFALLLVPSSLISRCNDLNTAPSCPETSSVLSRSSLAFGSAAALFEKLEREKSGFPETGLHLDIRGHGCSKENIESIEMTEVGAAGSTENMGNSYSMSSSPNTGFKFSKERFWELSMGRSMAQLRRSFNSAKDLELSVVRLNGRQAASLLSRLSLQATLPDNVPSCYEAIANTYILILLFSRAKTSNHKTVIRAFQLALSLRSLAIDPSYAGVQLPPSRRRSVFTLSTAMLVFAGRAYGVPQLGAVAKASLTSITKDPYLELSDDIRLKLVNSPTGYVNIKDYGSAADDRDAYKSFSGISISEEQAPEALAALIVGSSSILIADDFAVADQMLQPFAAEKENALASQLYFGASGSRGFPLESRDSRSFDKVVHNPETALEGDLMSDASGVELPQLLANFCPPLIPHAISVSQLLEEVLETAGKGANTTDAPLSYTAMASQCATFSADSQKKLSCVLKSDGEYGSLLLTFPEGWLSNSSTQEQEQHEHSRDVFQLPPTSPYDNFLKAAGCYMWY